MDIPLNCLYRNNPFVGDAVEISCICYLRARYIIALTKHPCSLMNLNESQKGRLGRGQLSGLSLYVKVTQA